MRIAETDHGMLNSIGLQGPGIDAFVADHLPRLGDARACRSGCPSAGSRPTTTRRAASGSTSDERVAAIELNLSCPNVEEAPETAAELVAAARAATAKPLYAKLSPAQWDIAECGPRRRRRRRRRPLARQHDPRARARSRHAAAAARARGRRLLGPGAQADRARVRLRVRRGGRPADRRHGRRRVRARRARARRGRRKRRRARHGALRRPAAPGARSGPSSQAEARGPWVRRPCSTRAGSSVVRSEKYLQIAQNSTA